MMKFMRKSKGFISIFLCIVLLPMVTFSALVIDVSRLQNARTLITSAGDLAMNAGMSEYNKTLQEMYGIFATNTTSKDLEKALSNYFAKTIEGSIGTSNLSEKDYIQKYAGDLSHWLLSVDNFDDTEFTNFIQMELDSADAFNYLGVNNSSPANPAVMKQQIVDYMKYKGPVSLSMNLFNKIGALKDSKKQVDAVEKKVDYTQSLDNLNDPCKKAFAAVYGSDTDKDVEGQKGYNDYVVDYNKFLASDDFKKGLKKNESKAYNEMADNLAKMNEFLLYYTTAKISAGDGITAPDQAITYNMTKLGGLDYEHFKKYMQNNNNGYNKCLNLSDIANCTTKFDELFGDFSLEKKKDDAQIRTLNKKDCVKYFTQGNANIKTDVEKISKYNSRANEKLLKSAELVKDTAKLSEDKHNISSQLLDGWEKNVHFGESTGEYDTLSKYDGETYDLILQEFDQGKKWEKIVEFILYWNQITDLKNSYNNQWEKYEKDINTKIETKQKALKDQYDYEKTQKGRTHKDLIESLKKDLEAYDGDDGYIAKKEKEISDKEGKISEKDQECKDKQEEIDNEKDATKKSDLEKELTALQTEKSTLESEKGTLDTELEDLKKQRQATETTLKTQEYLFKKEVEKRNKAAESDGQLLVWEEQEYFKNKMKKAIIEKYYDQVNKLKDRLENNVLDKLDDRVQEFYDHGKIYLKKSIDQIDNFYACVCNCYYWADESVKALEAVESSYKDVEKAYEAWTESAKNIDDDTTKATMLNDAKSTSSGLKKKDISNSVSIAKQRRIYFKTLKEMVENIRYFDAKLVDSTQGKIFTVTDTHVDSIYKIISGHTEKKGFGDVDHDKRNSKSIKATENNSKSKDMVDSHFLSSRNGSKYVAFDWDPAKISLAKDGADNGSVYELHYGDEMEGSKNKNLTEKETYEREKFFKVLVLIVKPKENTDSEAKSNATKAQTLTKNAVENNSTGGAASGKIKEEKSNISEKPSVAEKVLTEAQNQIMVYGKNGGKNLENEDNAGSSRNTFELSSDKDKYKDNSGKAKDSLKQASGLLDKLGNIGANALQDAYLEEYFTEMFTCQTDVLKKNIDRKMLNGVSIKEMYSNETEWYGGEMEYIIWGGDITSARVKNEVAIYAIRLALNAIYAFTAADIQEFTLAAATAIAGWTVVGVPLVQVLLTIGLAAAESGFDLIKLKNGEDVSLYKNASTFVCSPSGALKQAVTTVAKYAIEETLSEAKKAFDSQVDKFSEYAGDKLEEHMDEVKKLKDDYLKEQEENIKSTLKNMIATPLADKLKPVIMLKDSAVETFEADVDKALTNAFDDINDTLAGYGDGVIKELAVSLISDYSDTIKQQIKAEISKGGSVTADSLSRFINDKVDYYVGLLKTKIDEKLVQVGDKFMEEANKCKDSLCNNVKELSGKWASKAGENLTSEATKIIDEKLSDEAIEKLGITKKIDSGGSGGLTLNYKEYCKIFVLIGLLNENNEAAMLQRCAAICQANVQHPGSKFTADSSFKMVDVNTVVAVHAKVKLGTLFPWGVTVTEDGATDNTSVGFGHIGSNSVVIDYQGVNAY